MSRCELGVLECERTYRIITLRAWQVHDFYMAHCEKYVQLNTRMSRSNCIFSSLPVEKNMAVARFQWRITSDELHYMLRSQWTLRFSELYFQKCTSYNVSIH